MEILEKSIQNIGGKCQGLILPKKWLVAHNLKVGDIVQLETMDLKIVVRPCTCPTSIKSVEDRHC